MYKDLNMVSSLLQSKKTDVKYYRSLGENPKLQHVCRPLAKSFHKRLTSNRIYKARFPCTRFQPAQLALHGSGEIVQRSIPCG